jgi:hypothetical protein
MDSYWGITVSEILSEHGVSVTTQQTELIARDVERAAEVQGDYSSERIQTAPGPPQKSEDQKRIQKLERIVSALCALSGVSVDEYSMEMLVSVPCGTSHRATERIPLRLFS